MTIEQLQKKLNSEKNFYNILDTGLDTEFESGKLKIILMYPSLDSLAALHETLSLNGFITNSTIRISGHTISMVTMKKQPDLAIVR